MLCFPVSNKKLIELKALFCAMWHFVLARARQCLLWFSIESKSLTTLVWAPLLSTQKRRKTGWFPGVPFVSKVPFWQAWKLGKAVGRWTKHRKPRIYNLTLLPIKLALSGLWLLAPRHGHFHPLLHSWTLWKSSKQHPCLIPHMPGCPGLPSIHANYVSHLYYYYCSANAVTQCINHF